MYRTSNKPVHTASNSSAIFGGAAQDDVDAYNARIRAQKIHARRSAGQRVRHARERLYGKQSHIVTVRSI